MREASTGSRQPLTLLAALLLGPMPLAAFAAGEVPAAERERIRDERAAAHADFAAAERACQSRFAVTACVDEARRQRTQRLQRLRSQEALLDALERRDRAARRGAAIAEKQAEVEARASALAPSSRRMRIVNRGASAPPAATAASAPR